MWNLWGVTLLSPMELAILKQHRREARQEGLMEAMRQDIVEALAARFGSVLDTCPSKAPGDLLGGVHLWDIGVYRASDNRGNTPEEEIEDLKKIVAETGAKAVKFRLGGRMSKTADSRPGRTEALIPLARHTLRAKIPTG